MGIPLIVAEPQFAVVNSMYQVLQGRGFDAIFPLRLEDVADALNHMGERAMLVLSMDWPPALPLGAPPAPDFLRWVVAGNVVQPRAILCYSRSAAVAARIAAFAAHTDDFLVLPFPVTEAFISRLFLLFQLSQTPGWRKQSPDAPYNTGGGAIPDST